MDMKIGDPIGLKDSEGTDIRIGDLVQVDACTEHRIYLIQHNAITEKVVCHPEFSDSTATGSITGIAFSRNRHCIQVQIIGQGLSDDIRMKVIRSGIRCETCRFYDKPGAVCLHPTSPYWADNTAPDEGCTEHRHIIVDCSFGDEQ